MDLTAKCPLIPWAFCKDLSPTAGFVIPIDPPHVPPRTKEQRIASAAKRVLKTNAKTFSKLSEYEAKEKLVEQGKLQSLEDPLPIDPLEDELDHIVAKVEQRRRPNRSVKPKVSAKMAFQPGLGYAKLTEEMIREAYRRWDNGNGETFAAISRDMGVERITISRAVQGGSHKNLHAKLQQERESQDEDDGF